MPLHQLLPINHRHRLSNYPKINHLTHLTHAGRADVNGVYSHQVQHHL